MTPKAARGAGPDAGASVSWRAGRPAVPAGVLCALALHAALALAAWSVADQPGAVTAGRSGVVLDVYLAGEAHPPAAGASHGSDASVTHSPGAEPPRDPMPSGSASPEEPGVPEPVDSLRDRTPTAGGETLLKAQPPRRAARPRAQAVRKLQRHDAPQSPDAPGQDKQEPHPAATGQGNDQQARKEDPVTENSGQRDERPQWPGLGASDGPSFLRSVKPVYPDRARRAGREGLVVLRLSIDETGRLAEARVVNGAGYGFDEAALAAARASSYRPALRDGRGVASDVRFSVRFTLRGP